LRRESACCCAQAWNPSDRERVVLLLDVWHPALTEANRSAIRSHFLFNSSSWWSYNSPWGKVASHD
jgi:hypothetical protein